MKQRRKQTSVGEKRSRKNGLTCNTLEGEKKREREEAIIIYCSMYTTFWAAGRGENRCLLVSEAISRRNMRPFGQRWEKEGDCSWAPISLSPSPFKWEKRQREKEALKYLQLRFMGATRLLLLSPLRQESDRSQREERIGGRREGGQRLTEWGIIRTDRPTHDREKEGNQDILLLLHFLNLSGSLSRARKPCCSQTHQGQNRAQCVIFPKRANLLLPLTFLLSFQLKGGMGKRVAHGPGMPFHLVYPPPFLPSFLSFLF